MATFITGFELDYLNPAHHGYPKWPGGERWLNLYQSDDNTWVVMTKGLSNGTDKTFEVYLETADEIDADDFSSSWQTNLVYEAGRIVPQVPELKEKLSKYTYLTLQIQMDGAPDEWSLPSADGNIGLFISQHNGLLNIRLMRPQELQYCLDNGDAGRSQLAERYAQQGAATISSLDRDSVV